MEPMEVWNVTVRCDAPSSVHHVLLPFIFHTEEAAIALVEQIHASWNKIKWNDDGSLQPRLFRATDDFFGDTTFRLDHLTWVVLEDLRRIPKMMTYKEHREHLEKGGSKVGF